MKRYSEMTPEERMELIREEASVPQRSSPYGKYDPEKFKQNIEEMKQKCNIVIKGTEGTFSIQSAENSPIKDEFMEQLEQLESVLGELKSITITYKKAEVK